MKFSIQPIAALGFAWSILAVGAAIQARDLFVNPQAGNDSADGSTETSGDGHGPLQTIDRAIRLAEPGDTVHLAKAVYTEPVGIYGTKSGLPGKPITIDGHNAVISGCVPLELADWKEVGSGLYRNAAIFKTVLHSYEEWVERFSFVIDGKLIRMNHSVKAPGVAWKAPADLKPGEWTYQKEDEHAFVIKIDPAKKLADCRIEMPVLVSGVQFAGSISHVVIKNLTVTCVINDGFALTVGNEPGSKVRDIVFQNCTAIDCCDDGLSAHGDCDVRVDGLVCDGCSTGIASQGTSISEGVVTRNIHGVDLMFGQGTHVVRNSRIEARGGTAGVMVDVWSKAAGQDRCALKLDNVLITGSGGVTGIPDVVIINTANAILEVEHTTFSGMSLMIKNGGDMKLHDSIVAGGSRFKVEVTRDSLLEADRNLYDVEFLRMGGVSYSEPDFAGYRKATGQDAASQWRKVEAPALLRAANRPQIGDHPVGADMARIPGR